MKISWFFVEKHLQVGSLWSISEIIIDASASTEFNDHQRNVFCVFSGTGIGRLREHLNQTPTHHEYDDSWTMYEGDGGFNEEGQVYDDNMDAESTAQQQVNGVTGMTGATAIEETDEDIGDESELTG